MRIKMSAAQSFTTELKNVEEKFKTFLRENFHAEKTADTRQIGINQKVKFFGRNSD
jgi:hypothetical protein